MARHPGPPNRRPQLPPSPESSVNSILAAAEARLGVKLTPQQKIIADGETFVQWCLMLAANGLKVDGKPFTLENRRAMAELYARIPSTKEQCSRRGMVIMKCTQVGFTVMEILAGIYLALKFGPATVGYFMPDQRLAELKSGRRYMSIVRSVPQIHERMKVPGADGVAKLDEGNMGMRSIGDSLFVFGWTSGRASTESTPMDFLFFDEVQEMTASDLEKTYERMSASEYRYTLLGSTAKYPESDIHQQFLLGTQCSFHTRCPECGDMQPLVDYFPLCCAWDEDQIEPVTGTSGDYRYVCKQGHWIDDPQDGEWIARNPGALFESFHYPQMLSPTVSAGEIMRKYHQSTDKQNFNNRVLGRPWLNPEQTPVTLDAMARCVAAGKARGVEWQKGSRESYMGIDQMGQFNVVCIKERLPDNRQKVIHIEEIYSTNPFARCDELMATYNVAVCVVELGPNVNDSKAFALRHPGRVFICNSFGQLEGDMVQWGDRGRLNASERRTEDDYRDRYTVRMDQYRCMAHSFGRFTASEPECLFPDPQGLAQLVIDRGVSKMAAIAPRAFHHFTKTALVVEKDEEGGTNKYKRVVRKIGIDPHHSYANMLCDVAFMRLHSGSVIMLRDAKEKPSDAAGNLAKELPGMPSPILAMMEPPPPGDICGACCHYPLDGDGAVPRSAKCGLEGEHRNTDAKTTSCWAFDRRVRTYDS